MVRLILDKFSNKVGYPISTKEQFERLRKIQSTREEEQVIDILEVQLLIFQGKLDQAEENLQNIGNRLEGSDTMLLQDLILYKMCNISNSRGDVDVFLEQIQACCKQIDNHDPGFLPERYHVLGVAYMIKRMYKKSEDAFLNFLRAGREQHNDWIIAQAMGDLGQLFLRQDLYHEAREHLKYSIEGFRKLDRKDYLIQPLNDYALVLTNTGEPESAISVFEELLELSRDQEDRVNRGRSLFNLGLCHQKLDHFETALSYYHQAMEEEELHRSPALQQKVHNNLGLVYGSLKKNNLAIQHLQQAYELARRQEDEFQQRVVWNNILYYKLLNNHFSEGMKDEIEEIIAWFEKSDSPKMLIRSMRVLALYYRQKGQFDLAFNTLDNSIVKLDDFYNGHLQEQNREFAKQLKESMSRRERIRDLLEPDLQKSVQHNMIGNSDAIRNVVDMARKASKISGVNVLITGESGTGKEILSRLIHFNSARSKNRLVTVNCNAITSTLAESEFFGHTEGSFTGAVSNRIGFFEQASGGTLYLDEIGDMPLEIQSKLLRAIETGKIQPVGGEHEIEVDVRIVASTNKDLDDLILQNRFRLDLLHRINAIHIRIPPLQDREGDLELLIDHFIKEISKTMNRREVVVDPSYMQALKSYSFPGNVRELRNIVERSLILENTNTLTADSLPELKKGKGDVMVNHFGVLNLAEVEKITIFKALEKTEGSQIQASRLLGITESTLSRKLKRLRSNS